VGMGIEVMGKKNGNAVLEWERVGMGMGMIRWELEGNGNKKGKSFPHTSTLYDDAIIISLRTGMHHPITAM